MQKVKKKPIRTCLGCGEPKEKRSLVRIVRTPEGEILVDPTGKKSGRGAYICPKSECLEKARKRRSLERSLECEIPSEIYERLSKDISEAQSQVMEGGEDG
ncbi:MAG: YlxR family protein [Oscillospiraceae bacterium]|nr:YlxR family protein [Ruminococcus sp.]MCD8345468.1 YlxR family protein [Oscillospiraceae bacterium]